MDNIENKYFNWLYDYVCKGRFPDSISYKKVLTLLHQTEFTWSMPMDENRAGDGIDLRRRFSYEMCHDYNRMSYKINSPCSILEMMLALAIRCEETIMDDTRYGDRTCEWFWKMMNSLGLSGMFDRTFDRDEAEFIIQRFLNREYSPNGKGGLFYIRGCKKDLRKVEIWTQLNWYLNTIIGG